MTTIQHLTQAFINGRSQYPELYRAWVESSFSAGANIPNSTLLCNWQRLGEIDVLLRTIEADFASPANSQNLLAHHLQLMMSELWIGLAYAVVRAIRVRNDQVRDSIRLLARELTLVRVPLEKYEIVDDHRLETPLRMETYPSGSADTRQFVYDKSDPKRAHVLPCGVSERGSIMWMVFDHRQASQYWVERQNLADRLLSTFSHRSAAP